MDEYGKNKKKFVLVDYDHLHAKLTVKLMEDGIKYAILMREFLKAYTNDNDYIREWIENNPQIKISERSMKKRRAQQKRIALQETKFNLEQKEIDDIFDILADELGDE